MFTTNIAVCVGIVPTQLTCHGILSLCRSRSMSGVLYEVNISVDEDVLPAYMEWLAVHVQEMLAFDGFMSAEVTEPDGPGPFPVSDSGKHRIRRTVLYRVASLELLESYFSTHAARMREDGIARFGGRFEATRRVHKQLLSFVRA